MNASIDIELDSARIMALSLQTGIPPHEFKAFDPPSTWGSAVEAGGIKYLILSDVEMDEAIGYWQDCEVDAATRDTVIETPSAALRLALQAVIDAFEAPVPSKVAAAWGLNDPDATGDMTTYAFNVDRLNDEIQEWLVENLPWVREADGSLLVARVEDDALINAIREGEWYVDVETMDETIYYIFRKAGGTS